MQTQKGKGMNKFLKVGLFSATFLCISATQAAPLEDAMKSLAKKDIQSYREVIKKLGLRK